MQYALGVDLGTTHTAAAVHVGGRVEMVQLGVRRAEMPSVIHIGADGRTLVGDSAERHGLSDRGRLVREVKRRMGDPVSLLVGGSPYSAHALQARLLRHVVEAVTAQYEAPPSRVVVTYPANWGPYKREQLEQVFRGVPLSGVRTLTEPEAAAIHHAATERVAPGQVVAVYDLGGGTFDAAVLRRTATGYTMLGPPEGIEQLGGVDFDDAVFAHVAGVLGDAMSDMDTTAEDVTAALARLRRDCVEAKEALSYDTSVDVPVALPGLHTRVRLNRSEFEALIAPPLADTVVALRRAVRAAGLVPGDVAVVLLSGGSSRIPLVTQMVADALGRPVSLDPHPEHSIALGAALVAGEPYATAPDGPASGSGSVASPGVAAPAGASLLRGVARSSGPPPAGRSRPTDDADGPTATPPPRATHDTAADNPTALPPPRATHDTAADADADGRTAARSE